MAYQAKKHKRFQEDFELVSEEGEVVHTLHVSLDADDMVAKIGRKYAALTKALADTTEMKRKAEDAEEVMLATEALGQAVADLFEAVFGSDDAKTIIEFYEGRYIEMAKEVIPFISHCVIPRMYKIRDENKRRVLSGYNRKTRRRMFH